GVQGILIRLTGVLKEFFIFHFQINQHAVVYKETHWSEGYEGCVCQEEIQLYRESLKGGMEYLECDIPITGDARFPLGGQDRKGNSSAYRF
ncbi:hypothetical protein FRX31_009382, partial [Thalictrum thalictroides]